MEMAELKDIWREYDKKLEKQVKFNARILRKMNLDRTHSELTKFTRTPFWGLAIGLVILMGMGIFISNHLSLPQYILPAALISAFALFQVVFSGHQLSIILPSSEGGEMNYDLPVIEIQTKLERLRVNRIRFLTVTRFSYALLWLPFLIVGFKVLVKADFYRYFNSTWILTTLLCGLVFTGIGIWLSIKFAERDSTSPVLEKWLNMFQKNDITGKNLYSAIAFLKELEAFEKED